MTRKLLQPRKVGVQLRSAIAGEIERAAATLERAAPDREALDDAVHETRRALKRARSLLRLGRAGAPHSLRRDLNRALAAENRRLSEVRDRRARLEALDRLVADERGPTGPLRALRWWLLHEAGEAGGCPPEPSERRDAARRLRETASRAAALRFDVRGYELLQPGLGRILRRGRRARSAVRGRPDRAAYHELRKRTKDLRYALDFLEPVWPSVCATLEAEAHRLTDLLGEANDLTLVLHALAAESDPDDLGAFLRAERAGLWARARPLAETLWAVPPVDFVRLVGRWWRVWIPDTH